MSSSAGGPIDEPVDELVDGPGPLLDGRVAVITGGGGGIGAAAAALFARHGARVVIAEIDEERGHATVDEIGDAASLRADRRT